VSIAQHYFVPVIFVSVKIILISGLHISSITVYNCIKIWLAVFKMLVAQIIFVNTKTDVSQMSPTSHLIMYTIQSIHHFVFMPLHQFLVFFQFFCMISYLRTCCQTRSVASLRLLVTRCGNWWCHLFSHHRPLRSDDLASRSHHHHSLLLRLSASFIQCFCKFSRKKLISFGCHPPDDVTLGGPTIRPPPLADAT